MKIRDLVDHLDALGQSPRFVSQASLDTDVRGVVYDSRKISRARGEIFACFNGEHVDGHSYIKQAIEAGAAAVLCERVIDGLEVPVIAAPNVRRYMGVVASVLCGRPSDHLKMFAVTGTNGKTTTAYMVRSLLRSSGIKTGMLGTIVYDDAEREIEADRTTPEGSDLQEMLARMVANGAEACVMEASSHGIHQGRISGCVYDCMGFSNLTPEHLEYHSDMEAYFEAKRMLFRDYGRASWRAAVNADDPFGMRLINEFGHQIMPYSAERCTPGVLYAHAVDRTISGTNIEMAFLSGKRAVFKIPFIGDHNVYNFLEASAMAMSVYLSEDDVVSCAQGCSQVPGRLERYSLENGASVFIDYAHSPDGVEHILTALRPLTRRKLRILWGAGGDRSKAKRPLTGAVMSRLADHSIITTDNPRSESPADIARDVESGFGGSSHEIILDRREAIVRLLEMTGDGDVAIVAGKGPETTIKYADHTEHFSDKEEILAWVAARGSETI